MFSVTAFIAVVPNHRINDHGLGLWTKLPWSPQIFIKDYPVLIPDMLSSAEYSVCGVWLSVPESEHMESKLFGFEMGIAAPDRVIESGGDVETS